MREKILSLIESYKTKNKISPNVMMMSYTHFWELHNSVYTRKDGTKVYCGLIIKRTADIKNDQIILAKI